ncbi:OLC1v1012616C1 [Oldenlandia corymbosa var. corymbosa]|uniref:OLC1v1012616C1 n=1 Tax=Oldenlandia corymbosa var. corymbosa TaxID=529605 RepID=A0AAV1DYF3_OLDCO|nr:OLC1v1012616C1 [Oldenlandia corymbosa var. corymbosa]
MSFTIKNHAGQLRPLPAYAGAVVGLAVFAAIFLVDPTSARRPHVINFRAHNLYPESFVWDPKDQHFIVGSLRHPSLQSVSDAGVSETLISDPSLPPNTSFLGLSIDRQRRRVLVCVHRQSSPPFNALASYEISSGKRIFLTPLVGDSESHDVANDVAVDYSGNAFVTNSGADLIWKVNVDGEASILSKSKVFKSHPVDETAFYHKCGLNGVVYHSNGYLLVVQSNTGKLYKVDTDSGSAKTVILNKDITAADGVAIRNDGVLVAASHSKMYFLKSQDGWSEGVVFDETALEVEKQTSAVAVGEQNRVYALYGYVYEGMMGNSKRDEFGIEEIESEVENKGEKIWIYVLIGLGMTYFMIWRFQMKKLVRDMNKKKN